MYLLWVEHQNIVGYLLHPPNFDDWICSTDKRCIRKEIILKKHTLVDLA